jgi:hypothetical protein
MTTTSRYRFQDRRRTAKRVTILSVATAVIVCAASQEFPSVEPVFERFGVPLLVGWLLALGGCSFLSAVFSWGSRQEHFWQVLIGVTYMIGGFDLLAWAIGILVGVSILMSSVTKLRSHLSVVSEKPTISSVGVMPPQAHNRAVIRTS